MSTNHHPDGSTPSGFEPHGETTREVPNGHGSPTWAAAGSQSAQPHEGGYGSASSQGQQYGQQQPHAQQPSQAPYGQASPQYGQPHGEAQYGQGQYGQPHGQNAYGQQYGQGQYGHGAYGQPFGQGMMPTAALAGWGTRVAARLIDGLVSIVPLLILGGLGLYLAFKDSYTVDDEFGNSSTEGVNGFGFALFGLALLASVLFNFWNLGARQGKTGQSIGKKALGIKVIDERTGQPAGVGAGLGRYLVEGLLGIVPFLPLIDVLWPLWDDKNQALHDKIVHTLVVRAQP